MADSDRRINFSNALLIVQVGEYLEKQEQLLKSELLAIETTLATIQKIREEAHEVVTNDEDQDLIPLRNKPNWMS